MPTKQLGWLTPLEGLDQGLGKANLWPTGAHLRILGCRLQSLQQNPELAKETKSGTEISRRLFAGYDSTDIFREASHPGYSRL